MAIAWFICGYKQKAGGPFGRPFRYCAMDDFTQQIEADGGAWSESEVLGGYALVKVRASEGTLSVIGGTGGFQRVPNWINLNDTLGDLTTAQRNAILSKIQEMGYTLAEISAVLGGNLASWRTKTFGQLLRFIAQRRLKPRWDDVQEQIVLDGELQACRPVSDVDEVVQ